MDVNHFIIKMIFSLVFFYNKNMEELSLTITI